MSILRQRSSQIVIHWKHLFDLGATPRPNRNHTPKANGCGSLGLQIDSQYLPVGEMTKCCDLHDMCYDTCNSDKEVCDMEFKRCLYRYCESYEKTVGGNTIVKGTATDCNNYEKCNCVLSIPNSL